MHAGNARTLEAMLDPQFAPHHQALAPNFLLESDPEQVSKQVDELVQYLLVHRRGSVSALDLPEARRPGWRTVPGGLHAGASHNAHDADDVPLTNHCCWSEPRADPPSARGLFSLLA